MVANTAHINGIISEATIMPLGSTFSFTSLSAQLAIVSAPPVENGDMAVDSPPI